jgi:hypothetical protein
MASDPADSFAVLRTVSDDASRRHAVVYRYDHADSSSRPVAVWIVSGDAPDTRSNNRPQGSPSLVWTGAAESLRLDWPKGHRTLSASVNGPAVLRDESRFQDCYFEYERQTDLLCFDSKKVAASVRAGD